MKLVFTLGFCLIITQLFAQTSADKAQKLNNYIKFVNESSAYIERMMKCLDKFHQDAKKVKNSKYKDRDRLYNYTQYACANRPKEVDFYYDTEIQKNTLPALNTAVQNFRQALDKLDKQGKELEAYIRLEEFKQDGFKKSDQILNDFVPLWQNYKTAQSALHQAVMKEYLSSQTAAIPAFKAAETQMLGILESEAKLLSSWNYNLNAENPSGWSTQLLEENVLKNDELLRQIKKSTLPYPANSMYDSFMSGLREMQTIKRDAIDKFTPAAQMTDEHPNYVYLSLLNYYNNVLVSFFNSMVDYSKQQNVSLIYQDKFTPVFELKTQNNTPNFQVKPFEDKPRPEFSIQKSTQVIPKNAHTALNRYIEFVNEGLRANRPLIWVLRNMNQDYNNAKTRDKAYISFNLTDYVVPKSVYQQALDESKVLPSAYQKSLNTQLEVLLNILNELQQLNAVIMRYVNQKAYEQDKLKFLGESLKRYEVLLNVFDEKKEQLYQDVRQVHESYQAPKGSWTTSGLALLQTNDLTKESLFEVKKFAKGDSTVRPRVEPLNQLETNYKNLIINEYDNMKGIERIGRNNGTCPYNPYEDTPPIAKSFREEALKFEQKIQSPYFKKNDFYNSYVYKHNELIYQYNKFAELSPVALLQNINQPEVFVLESPKPIKTPPPTEEKTKTKDDEEEKKPEFMQTMTGYAVNNLVFLLDISSSMSSPEKLPLLKKSINYLIGIMRPEDEISVVIYSGNAEVVLEGISAKKTDKIQKAIDKLKSGGNTNGEAGIKLAYETALKNFINQGNNRIILATDGEFPISDKTYQLAAENATKDISLTVFSFGKVEKKYDKLIKLADSAQGRYEHLTEENADFKLVKEAKAKKLK
jgi:Mg-chelatase subunit ChlD